MTGGALLILALATQGDSPPARPFRDPVHVALSADLRPATLAAADFDGNGVLEGSTVRFCIFASQARRY